MAGTAEYKNKDIVGKVAVTDGFKFNMHMYVHR